MEKIVLKAEERNVFGKAVSKLRKAGVLPGHVFGKKVETESVSVKAADFIKTYKEAGETGLVELKIGEEKVRPVLIRQVHKDPVKGEILNIDFYQVNLLEKTNVNVPIILTGEEPEIVHAGEAVVIQPMLEVEVEALPRDLPESIEVDITSLKAIDDAITVEQLKVPEGVTILAEGEQVVVKLDNAVTAEMQELLEEQAAEQAAAAEAAEEAEGGEAVEGEEGAESAEGQGPEESKGEEKAPEEGQKEESAE